MHVRLYWTLVPLGFVKVVYSLFVFGVFFCLFVFKSLQYHFKLSAIYQHISGITAEFLESSTTSGVQILQSIWTRESKYFEVVGLHGGPTIYFREGPITSALLWSIWTGGNYFRGVHFFCDSTTVEWIKLFKNYACASYLTPPPIIQLPSPLSTPWKFNCVIICT